MAARRGAWRRIGAHVAARRGAWRRIGAHVAARRGAWRRIGAHVAARRGTPRCGPWLRGRVGTNLRVADNRRGAEQAEPARLDAAVLEEGILAHEQRAEHAQRPIVELGLRLEQRAVGERHHVDWAHGWRVGADRRGRGAVQCPRGHGIRPRYHEHRRRPLRRTRPLVSHGRVASLRVIDGSRAAARARDASQALRVAAVGTHLQRARHACIRRQLHAPTTAARTGARRVACAAVRAGAHGGEGARAVDEAQRRHEDDHSAARGAGATRAVVLAAQVSDQLARGARCARRAPHAPTWPLTIGGDGAVILQVCLRHEDDRATAKALRNGRPTAGHPPTRVPLPRALRFDPRGCGRPPSHNPSGRVRVGPLGSAPGFDPNGSICT